MFLPNGTVKLTDLLVINGQDDEVEKSPQVAKNYMDKAANQMALFVVSVRVIRGEKSVNRKQIIVLCSRIE